jgi:hypothetical protein
MNLADTYHMSRLSTLDNAIGLMACPDYNEMTDKSLASLLRERDIDANLMDANVFEINLQTVLDVVSQSPKRPRQSREMLAAPISMALVRLYKDTFKGRSASQCVKKVESLQHMLAQSKAMNLLNRGIFYGRVELAAFIVATNVCIDDLLKGSLASQPGHRYVALKRVLNAAWDDLGIARCRTGFVCGYSWTTLKFLVDRMQPNIEIQPELEKALFQCGGLAVELNYRYRSDFDKICEGVKQGII